jgi:hypothetical protein
MPIFIPVGKASHLPLRAESGQAVDHLGKSALCQ